MKQEVLIGVAGAVQRREGQPRKRWEMAGPNSFPQQPAPFDVVVTVEIAAADILCSPLQPSEETNAKEESRSYLQPV